MSTEVTHDNSTRMNTTDIRIHRSQRKTLSLHILSDRTIVVRAPLYASDFHIHSFIEKNEEWIQKKMKLFEHRPITMKKQYKEGEQFLYLGTPYTLTIGNYSKIAMQETKLLFPQFMSFRIEREITQWYIAKAREVITERVKLNANVMNVSYINISFSDTKSKWGSCTFDNKLQFNWRLVMAPILVVNYVVVHELAHILEKNHSQDFWRKVSNINPSFRQQVKWLKTYGDSLVF